MFFKRLIIVPYLLEGYWQPAVGMKSYLSLQSYILNMLMVKRTILFFVNFSPFSFSNNILMSNFAPA